MDVSNIFKIYKLSRTDSREMVLTILLNNETLTAYEIQDLSDFQLNRITIYRCLKVFLTKGIVCLLKDNNGKLKYFFNRNKGNNHVHFKCSQCGSFSTLSNSTIQYKPLLKKYIVVEKSLFIIGICADCNVGPADF